MSDESQGPGWWIASDGKWYAPERHPDVLAQAPPPAAEQPAPASRQPFDPWIEQARAAAHSAVASQPAPSTRSGVNRHGPRASRRWAGGQGSFAAGGAGTRSVRIKPVLVVVAVVLVLALIGSGSFLALGGSSPNGSPQSVAASALGDFQAGNLQALCTLAAPANQATCRAGMLFASAFTVTGKNLAIGNVTVRGSEALAVVTGSICLASVNAGAATCRSNADRNAALDKGQSFADAYKSATSGTATSTLTLALVEQGGKWYLATS